MSEYVIQRMHGKHIITHPDKHGKITVVGNGHLIDLQYGTPEWSKEDETFFTYRGETYWLSEFMGINTPTDYHSRG